MSLNRMHFLSHQDSPDAHCKADGTSCQGIGPQATGEYLVRDDSGLLKPQLYASWSA